MSTHTLRSIASSKLLRLSCLVFAVYALIGLLTLRSYSITWDEPENFAAGRRTLSFWLAGDRGALEGQIPRIPIPLGLRDDGHLERYPPFVSALASFSSLIFAETFHLVHPVTAHHAAIVLISAMGVAAVFAMTSVLTGTVLAGLAGATALGLHPHFFGHMHNNAKDAPSTALIACALLFMMLMVKVRQSRMGYVLAAGLLTGLAAATKFSGVMLIPVGIAAVFLGSGGKTIRYMFIYGAAVLGMTFLAWPWFAMDPVGRLPMIWAYVTQVGHGLPVLFYGETYGAGTTAPWYYAPVMFFLTYPPSLMILVLPGLYGAVIRKSERKMIAIPFLWLCISLGRMMLPGSVVYNGIRQGMDVLIPLAVLAGYGWATVAGMLKPVWRMGVLVMVLGSLVWITITFHPYQALYYNRFAGDLKSASSRFEFDYWGFSLGEMVRYANTIGTSDDVLDTNWILFKRSYFPGNTRMISSDSPKRTYVLLPHSENYFSGATAYWTEHGKLIHTVKRHGADVGYIFQTSP